MWAHMTGFVIAELYKICTQDLFGLVWCEDPWIWIEVQNQVSFLHAYSGPAWKNQVGPFRQQRLKRSWSHWTRRHRELEKRARCGQFATLTEGEQTTNQSGWTLRLSPWKQHRWHGPRTTVYKTSLLVWWLLGGFAEVHNKVWIENYFCSQGQWKKLQLESRSKKPFPHWVGLNWKVGHTCAVLLLGLTLFPHWHR